MTADDHDAVRRPRRIRAALIGLAAGFLLGVVLLLIIGGNPFSSANEVVYRDVVVGSVSDAGDSLCWSDEPGDRDEPRTCAVLALDPQVSVPRPGETVTIGVVDIAPPGFESQRQVVYAAPADVAETASPTPPDADSS